MSFLASYAATERKRNTRGTFWATGVRVKALACLEQEEEEEEEEKPKRCLLPLCSYLNSFPPPFKFSVVNIQCYFSVILISSVILVPGVRYHHSILPCIGAREEVLENDVWVAFLGMIYSICGIMWYLWHLQALSIFNKSNHPLPHSTRYTDYHLKPPPLN